MADPRDNDLHELARRVASAEYSVDPSAVADVIVRRRWVVTLAPEPARVYSIASHRRTRARVRSVAPYATYTRARAAAA